MYILSQLTLARVGSNACYLSTLPFLQRRIPPFKYIFSLFFSACFFLLLPFTLPRFFGTLTAHSRRSALWTVLITVIEKSNARPFSPAKCRCTHPSGRNNQSFANSLFVVAFVVIALAPFYHHRPDWLSFPRFCVPRASANVNKLAIKRSRSVWGREGDEWVINMCFLSFYMIIG